MRNNKNLTAIINFLYEDAGQQLPQYGYLIAGSWAEAQLIANRAKYWGETQYDKPLPPDFKQEVFTGVIDEGASIDSAVKAWASTSAESIGVLGMKERVVDMLMFDSIAVIYVAPAEEWNRAVSAIKATLGTILSRLP